MRNKMSFAKGNCIKYVSRAGKKQYDGMSMDDSAITDLKKAIRYLEMEINLITEQEVL